MRAALLSVALAASCLAAASPAAACVPPPGWPLKVRLAPTALARELFDAAATVDVAVAETMTDDFEVGTSAEAYAAARSNFEDGPDPVAGPLTPERVSALLRDDWQGEGVRIHYRVVERLKGSSPESFTLNGARLPPGPPPPRRLVRLTRNPMTSLKLRLDSRDLSDWEGFGACITALYSDVGARYLIFRDADGHLLRQKVDVRFLNDTVRVGGPVYAEIRSSADPWLAAVRGAAAR
jgi:hypothetical protein